MHHADDPPRILGECEGPKGHFMESIFYGGGFHFFRVPTGRSLLFLSSLATFAEQGCVVNSCKELYRGGPFGPQPTRSPITRIKS